MNKVSNSSPLIFRVFCWALLAVMVFGLTGLVTEPVSAKGPVQEKLVLSRLSKVQAGLNSAPFNLFLMGQGFKTGAVVLWGDKEFTPFEGSSRILKVAVTAELLAVPGEYRLKVQNPDGKVSNYKKFRVLNRYDKPVITALKPNKVYAQADAAGQTFELKIYGRSFIPQAEIKWYDPISKVTTTLTRVGDCTPRLCVATVDKALIATRNMPRITVVNGTARSNFKVLLVKASRPVLTSMDPEGAAAGSDAFVLNLTGDKFMKDSRVMWGEDRLPGMITFVDSQHISVEVPAEYLVDPGEVEVKVVNTGGGASGALVFTITE